jgi:beta-N-acetylhexosaminidase
VAAVWSEKNNIPSDCSFVKESLMTRPIQAALLSCQGLVLTDDEKHLFAKANPVGFTLFKRNISSAQQLKALTNELKEVLERDNVLIAVDQEGGRVRRLQEPEFTPVVSELELGSLPLKQAQEAAQLQAELIAQDLIRCGINTNFAPVLDVLHPNTTQALHSRCFSDNPQIVSTLGQAMINAYQTYGIIPCMKHMPGHGLATTDPHLGLPVITESLDVLAGEFYPFQQCHTSPCGMTAHILLTTIDDKHPLTQSAIGIQTVIRQIISFDGFLISDAIDMHALQGTISEKALCSLNAGCDAVCYALGNITEMAALTKICPQLSDESTERLDKALQILHNRKPVSALAQMRESYQQLVGQVEPYRETYDATEVLNLLQQQDTTKC